ncbi:MAG: DUF3501 family protein [Acidimicrobiales bacterium]
MTTPLTLDDIADARAYERERDQFRAHVIELKKKRRVTVGPFVTLVFECRDTIRFQIQEMARAERILTDQGIQTELDVYNPLLPGDGRLSATMFLELTTDDMLREWLPKLVGVERSVELRMGDHVVPCTPEAGHESQLTRDETTAAVHYVEFHLDTAQSDAFATGEVDLAVAHPAYAHQIRLGADTHAELVADLRST